ncbi:hypothetical protein FKP32DRAFT_87479 [Trametes sanguinea]|nr:hypothetical protein FKP32DRAFT_87479 [Trametes sanguinea]
MVSKTITINGTSLGTPVNLTLAFVPNSADFQNIVPIAWKVITLSDGDSISYNWTDTIGGCRADIDNNTGVVTAEEYTPVPVGRSADMLKDASKRPPVYYFTTPKPFGQQTARVMNRTNDYVNVGAGFITDYNLPNEEFNPIYVCPRVMDSTPVYVNYEPKLYLWASMDYVESELLDQSVTTTQSLWNQDVSKLTGTQITITVKRVNGVLVAEGPSGAGGKALAVAAAQVNRYRPRKMTRRTQSSVQASPLVYKADLAFANPGIVTSGVRAIVDHLAPEGYAFKFTTKGYDTEAQLEVTPPKQVASCNQAELDLIAAIDANKTIFGKAFIKAHSGATLLGNDHGLETWVDINPATLQWFGASQGAAETNAAFSGKDNEDLVKAANSNGNGNGNGDAAAADAPKADVEDSTPKFASVRRGGRRTIPTF